MILVFVCLFAAVLFICVHKRNPNLGEVAFEKCLSEAAAKQRLLVLEVKTGAAEHPRWPTIFRYAFNKIGREDQPVVGERSAESRVVFDIGKTSALLSVVAHINQSRVIEWRIESDLTNSATAEALRKNFVACLESRMGS